MTTVVFAAMDHHPDVAVVQLIGCDALAKMSENGDTEAKIVAEGGLARILTAMDRHVDKSDVQWTACVS
jgi:hypothetical protein